MELGILSVLWVGLLAGVVHVYSGADHMAALLPLSAGRGWRAWLIGARWGIGHSAGVLIIGLLAVLLKEQIDLEMVGAWGERLVGVMLIGIGALGLRWAFRARFHVHTHTHDGDKHAHLHVHLDEEHDPGRPHGHPHVHTHTAMFAGILHGLAGTSHLLGVLPAVAMKSAANSVGYLAAYAVGSIVAMGLFGLVFGGGTKRLGTRGPAVYRTLMVACSALTIAIGVAWIVVPLLGGELPELL